jgi:hypothetical protein
MKPSFRDAPGAGPESIIPNRGYGFSDVQSHIIVRRFAPPRNDGVLFK